MGACAQMRVRRRRTAPRDPRKSVGRSGSRRGPSEANQHVGGERVPLVAADLAQARRTQLLAHCEEQLDVDGR
jgi:hypothetical protein